MSATSPRDSKRVGFPTIDELLELIRELSRIRKDMVELEGSVDLKQFGARRASAANLLHYVALRRQDIRGIQEKLELMGISTLGRSESHVLYNIDSVISILKGLATESIIAEPSSYGVSPLEGREILERNADALFGRCEAGRGVRIMVTMPTEAAVDYYMVRDLLEAGMDVMRINCAHDTEIEWFGMIQNLRKSEKEVGRKCKVLMDIAGPKLRTGKLQPGPQVMRIKPERDVFGRVVSPATVFLTASGGSKNPPDASIPVLEVQGQWLQRVSGGDTVTLEDARGSKRSMKVSVGRGRHVRAASRKTIYLDATTELVLTKGRSRHSTTVSNIPHRENPILLKKGDRLLVTASQSAGRPAFRGRPGRIPCTLPEALRFVKPGERIWFDDGKIGGLVKSTAGKELLVEVTHAAEDGTKLREDKGINLPDTNLKLLPLTPKDLEDLRFIAKHADMVGYSFVRTPEDLRALRSELERLKRKDMAVIIKLETLRAFEQLPSLLLESMLSPVSGVMIARGDLAVECGFERLAEVQEEILWMSEAAHMPAIWATQVLEGLTKNGVPSRAEVTDAAVGERAECVMLNKGPHAVDAVQALDSILRRMQAHQVKKKSMMRQLNIASSFFKAVGVG